MAKGFRYLRKRKNPLPRLLGLTIPILVFFLTAGQAVFATTYVITDGPRVYTLPAFRSDPARILDEVGVQLDRLDSYTADSESITIQRAGSIHLYYHGKPTRISSDGETVGQLLSRLKLPMDENDVISLPENTKLLDGMTLRIDSVVHMQQRYSVAVPADIRFCQDSSLPEGLQETLVDSRDGELLRTADVTYVNGVETRREILREDVTSPPVSGLIAIGSGDPLPRLAVDAPPIITEKTIRLSTGEVLTYTHTAQIRATAYTHTDEGCNMTTATGSTVHVGTVAVDPRFVPYGTRMFIIASDGSYIYGIAQAEDCGGDIIGDRMDLYLPTFEDCIEFGRRVCTVYFLG